MTDGAGDPFPGDLNVRPVASLVPNTLPRLRYGTAYGCACTPSIFRECRSPYATDDHASPAQAFKRFQPIAHPVVVQRHAVTEGESTLRMVIRSGVSGDPDDAGAALTPVAPSSYSTDLNTGTPRQFATYRAECERHLAPPKVNQTDSELLGRIDAGAIGVVRLLPTTARHMRGLGESRDPAGCQDPFGHRSARRQAADGIHRVPPLAHDGDSTAAELDATLAALPRGQAPDPGSQSFTTRITWRCPTCRISWRTVSHCGS